MVKYHVVNEQGIKEIKEFLKEYHIHYKYINVDAYVKDVEFQLAEGNSPSFEISKMNCNCGYSVLCELSNDSYDTIGDDEQEE